MSVPDITGNNDPASKLISRSRARALEHTSAIERGLIAEQFGVVPNLLARFSLIPTRGIDQNAPMWQRANDYAMITITPGPVYDRATRRLTPGRIPAGGLANLSFLWCVNQVRDNLAREVDDPTRIDLGDTLSAYLRNVGVSAGGMTRRNAMQVMQSVLGASIQFHTFADEARDDVAGETYRMVKVDVATSYELWVPTGNELEGFKPFAVASPMFLKLAADDHAVPVRMDLLAQLADSVLAQQAINWLSLQVFRLDVSGDSALEFTWDDLYRNITHNSASEKDFRVAWKKAITRVLHYWPELEPHIDLAAIPENRGSGSGQRRVIKIRRGTRPLVQPKRSREVGE